MKISNILLGIAAVLLIIASSGASFAAAFLMVQMPASVMAAAKATAIAVGAFALQTGTFALLYGKRWSSFLALAWLMAGFGLSGFVWALNLDAGLAILATVILVAVSGKFASKVLAKAGVE